MIILGLNVFHADSAACIIVDGKIIAAVEEERFTRIKHFTGFPKNSIDFCLSKASLKLDDVDYITVNYNKRYNFKKKFFFIFKRFFSGIIIKKILSTFRRNSLNKYFIKYYEYDISKKINFIPHHLAHIASTFLIHKIDKAIGFSFDGSGDFSTVEVYSLGDEFKLLEKIHYPDSLGILYQAFTQFLGFKNYGDEYKVMGLASYGKPIFQDRIKKVFVDNKNFFNLNLKYFEHHESIVDYDFESGYPFFDDLYSVKLENLLGKSRKPHEPIEQIHKDIAASLQKVFEDIILKKINNLHKKYTSDNLCLAGGCAFNSSLNGKIINQSNFKNIYFSPNVGDAGGAVGSALFFAKKKGEKIPHQLNPYLGTSYDNEYVSKNVINVIKNIKNIKYKYYEDLRSLYDFVSQKIMDGGVVGWFQDSMEWGPRALGNRSILGDSRNPNMRDIINSKIKRREEFRPFAPSVLKEKANIYFKMKGEAPHMSAVYEVIGNMKDLLPAVVHVDNTSRVQTVDQNINPKFYNLIKSFEAKTGIPIILNTSLNINEPICENPENALEIFTKTSMDMMVMQNWVMWKDE